MIIVNIASPRTEWGLPADCGLQNDSGLRCRNVQATEPMEGDVRVPESRQSQGRQRLLNPEVAAACGRSGSRSRNWNRGGAAGERQAAGAARRAQGCGKGALFSGMCPECWPGTESPGTGSLRSCYFFPPCGDSGRW